MLQEKYPRPAGIEPTDVNYLAHSGGAELATALLSGTISASVSGYADFKDQIEAGRLKIIAVSSPEPVDGIDAPTLTEEGYDVELTNWRGVVAPPGVTDDERQELVNIFDEMMATENWQQTLERNQWTDTSLIGDEFSANLEEETSLVNSIWADLGY